MKRNLLLSLALLSAVSFSAQVLEFDNYNSYTNGNVGTNTTGASMGQGSMYLSGGAAADYQIVTGDAAHGKYLQIIGGNEGTALSSRAAYKGSFATAWAARTPGNNIVKGKVDIFTGTSTNQHASGVGVFGVTDGIVGIRYNSETKTINGLAYLDVPGQSGFYNITGITTNTYPANTWVTLAYTYNKTSGEITYQIGNEIPLVLAVDGADTVAGLDPARFRVLSSPTRATATGPINAGPTTFGIDNYVVTASNSITLGTSDVETKKASVIAIGPNPTADYLNILTDLKITNLEIYDISGRKISAQLEGNKVDVKNLNPGTYILNFETKEGKTSEKFIKK
ncbi:T9SS type A sorting domain-containing protein [Chryseobacterium sp.]|uniref:T9SS type A sorting domain-containing protein n=1 Tax=Chryseobacterium sp. TaxID=1871047 RepID=UPI000ED3D012|nr:T9SS type A sorting domain-containing protein [Chryseobacterium sp.]HCA09779.1 hypothetical protein [Chryseobacterium sp.]